MVRKTSLIPAQNVEELIFLIRGHKVMLSMDLAGLYGVEPRVLVQALKRNRERFPKDFMFQLTEKEFQNLKSQIVISSWGGMRRAGLTLSPNKGLQCSRVCCEANVPRK